jgi:hypothetical protein
VQVLAGLFGSLGTHLLLPLHQLPVEQSVSLAQVLLQAVPPSDSQVYVPHEFVLVAGQVPSPAHPASEVATPLVQAAAMHCVPEPG